MRELGANRIDCFVRGTEQAMWHRWWDGSPWGGWESLGGVTGTPTAPAGGRTGSTASSAPPTGRCGIAGGTASPGAAGRASAASSWSSPNASAGGQTASIASPAVSTAPSGIAGGTGILGRLGESRRRNPGGGELRQLGHQPDRLLRPRSRQRDVASLVERVRLARLGSLGGIILEQPNCVSWGPGRIDCFARGFDNAMWHRWWPCPRASSPSIVFRSVGSQPLACPMRTQRDPGGCRDYLTGERWTWGCRLRGRLLARW